MSKPNDADRGSLVQPLEAADTIRAMIWGGGHDAASAALAALSKKLDGDPGPYAEAARLLVVLLGDVHDAETAASSRGGSPRRQAQKSDAAAEANDKFEALAQLVHNIIHPDPPLQLPVEEQKSSPLPKPGE